MSVAPFHPSRSGRCSKSGTRFRSTGTEPRSSFKAFSSPETQSIFARKRPKPDCSHLIFRKNVHPAIQSRGGLIRDHASERGTAAELELLHAVVRTLGQRNRVVEAQRSER